MLIDSNNIHNNHKGKGLALYIALSYTLAYSLDFTLVIPKLHSVQELNIDYSYFLTIGALIARMWTPALSVVIVSKLVHRENPLSLLGSTSIRETGYMEAFKIAAVILAGYTVASLIAIILGARVGRCGYYQYLNPLIILGEIALGLTLGVTVNSAVALGEEIGWRGYMYTVLRENYSMTWTAVIIGATWGLWHAPLILSGYNYIRLIPGCTEHPGSIVSLLDFLMYTISASILLTEIREQTGSIYSAAVGHGVINGVASRMSILVIGNPLTGLPAGLSASAGLLLASLVWRRWCRSG